MLFVASNELLSLDLDNEIMITWTANENILYDSIHIATNVISNTWEYVLGTDCLTWKGVGRGRGVCYVFFLQKYFDAELSRKKHFCKQNARKNILMQDFHPEK